MKIDSRFLKLSSGICGALLASSSLAFAQDAPAQVTPEVSYILNTMLFLIGGFLVMFMGAGFAMLEAGLVRSKNVSMQCLKNIAIYSVAGIMFWACGYSLMYVGVDKGFIGSLSTYGFDEVGKFAAGEDGSVSSYSTASDWFFQMVFVATTASIVSGTLAERVKLWPFLAFTVVLTGFFYPITGAWKWGGGWLNEMGFQDFAGSTLVHSVGGWAALAGAIILGARLGKYEGGRVHPMPGSSIPLATLGTFILWLGWFGFNGASQLAWGSASDVTAVSNIFANTNLAAAGGVIAAMIGTQLLYKKVDVTMALNGALAGLVSITAEPLMPSPILSILIGAIGGVIVVFAVPMLDKLKIDDVVGAIPVHLLCGIWGTMAVPLSNPDSTFMTQFIGVAAIGGFTFVASFVVWAALKFTIGIRVSAEEEMMGLDKAEIGVEAYPEFTRG